MIQIRNTTRKYGSVLAVDRVTLSIQSGEVVGLLGHNGAGKTTLMKMLTGVLEPTEGTLSVAGKSLLTSRLEAQQHIGYLPESAPLYPEMTVFEYLRLMAELRGVERAQIDTAAINAARSAQLIERLGQPIRELSKGFRQRVGIAQAIVHQPDVLVLDEPTNGLDPVQIDSIRSLIRDLAKTSTIILSTHILSEVEAVCDRVVVLIQGKLVADSPLAELLHSDRWILSVRSDLTEVRGALSDISAITQIDAYGADPLNDGFQRFALSSTENIVEDVLGVVQDRGWPLAGIGREERTLETVFKELQIAHADSAQEVAS